MTRVWNWFLWGGALLVALTSLRFLIAPLDLVMEHMAHYRPQTPLALYAHLLAGPLALALTPFQLWQGLRARRPVLHRRIGYTYAVSALVAASAALALLPHYQGDVTSAWGFGISSVLWVGVTLRGIQLARAGDRAGHRRWMLHSVALCFAAVTLRIIMAPLMVAGWTPIETYMITAWAGWLPNMIAVEWWLRRQARRRAMAMA